MPPRAAFALLALSTLLTAACEGTAPPPSGGSEPATAGTGPVSTESAAPHRLVAGVPLTLRLPADEEVLAAVADLGTDATLETSLRLTVEGLVGGEPPASLRVFVNTPGADLETPTDQAGYVGDLGFFPAGGLGGADTFLLDLGQVLADLPPERRLVERRFLDVTLIVVPPLTTSADGARPPAGLRLDRLRVSAHPAPDEG